MNTRELTAGLDAVRHHVTTAVVSTVSLAKPATVVEGLGHVTHYATNAVASTVSLAKSQTVATGLGHVKQHAAAMVSTRQSAVKTAAVVLGGAVGAYFLWPAAAGTAAIGATMKAPGAAGLIISRASFMANPQLYFQILRTAGAAAAAAAFM